MVPVISLKTVKKHQKLDVKVASIAVVILKTIRNAHLKRVRKGDRTVTAEAVNLITPDLSDTYSAEKQLTRALSKLARAASSEKLSAAFTAHLEETQGQIERIDQIVEQEDGIKLKRMKCVAMEGLIEEPNEVIESTEKNEVRDAALIAAAQKVEHYEIASYGTLATLAEQLGYKKAVKLLAETLEEEKETDLKLTDLAVGNINQKAQK